MAIVSIRSDIARFATTLTDFQRTQLPYATALALTATARTAQAALTRDLPSIFSTKGRPTPFTLRAIGIAPARKSNLRAAVFVKRQQAKYLGIEETGGAVAPRPGAPILTPVDATLNVYGNLPRGTIKRLLRDPKRYFLGTVRGVYGLWERVAADGRGARGLRLVAAMRQRAHYRPRFGFRPRIAASVAANIVPQLSAAMAKAIATAVAR